jgi:hypothetical protein
MMTVLLSAGRAAGQGRRRPPLTPAHRFSLAGVGIKALGKGDGTRIGELLALSGSADIVDAYVALMTAPADLVLTSDPGDIRKL